MQTAESLQKKIKTTQDLLSIVKTMKSLAAVNIRQFEGAVNALDEHKRIVNMGWKMLFQRQQSIVSVRSNHQKICLILGSDQGMCGQFNERILEFLRQQENKWRYQPAEILYWSVGERIRSGLLNDARSIDEHFDLPGSPAGIHNLVQQLLQTLESYQRSRGVETFYILFNHIKSSVAFEPTALRLLPLDESWVGYVTSQPQTGRCIPRLGLPWETLFRHLFSQYIFVSFYRSLAQSLASENAARFQSMQAAEKNILEMTDNLQQKFRETRQNNITSELLDIVSGFEAMHNP